MSVGDVVCLRMPVSSGEDTAAVWSVDDPGKLRLWPDFGVAVACRGPGVATVSHRASPRLRSRIEILPLQKVKALILVQYRCLIRIY